MVHVDAAPIADARPGVLRSAPRLERLRDALRRRSGDHWEPTDALRRGLIVGVGLVGLGAVAHRVDVMLLGAPLLLAGLAGLVWRPRGSPEVRPLGAPRVVDTGRGREVSVLIDAGGDADVVAVRTPRPTGAEHGPVHVLRAGRYLLTCDASTDGWGDGLVLRTDHLLAAHDGMWVYGPVVGRATRQLVLPPVEPLRAGTLPPRAAGLVGAHRSRRPGDSTELRSIRPFAPGDRLRRIDWRVSLRHGFAQHGGGLHVRERHADADADVVLALDSRVDVGSAVGDWSDSTAPRTGSGDVTGRSSLDTAIRAATTLATGYLQQGDRVGLADLGRPQLYVSPGTGARQLRRVRHRLVLCASSAGWAPKPVLPPQLVPSGSTVLVLSPFLDDGVAQVAITAARRGGLVVAIDVLPQPLEPDDDTPWGPAALAILLAERRVRVDALAANGVPVIAWPDRDAGPLVVELLRRVTGGRRRPVARAR